MEYKMVGTPFNGRNCFGKAVPKRSPLPPAKIMAYFFKT